MHIRYDNCYAVEPTVMVDYVSEEAVSPDRFVAMADALNTTDRDILYQVCQWGTGTDLGIWYVVHDSEIPSLHKGLTG